MKSKGHPKTLWKKEEFCRDNHCSLYEAKPIGRNTGISEYIWNISCYSDSAKESSMLNH